MSRAREASTLFLTFLRLGLTSFGGPVAHIGYFRAEVVGRKGWFDDRTYADLVALCQFLPGPASSQVGMGIGFLRAGWAGALAAWSGFTLPSMMIMIGFGMGVMAAGDAEAAAWLHGLKLAAVAVVAQAVWGMAGTLCPDRPRAAIALAAAVGLLLAASPVLQLGAIVAGGVLGVLFLKPDPVAGGGETVRPPFGRRTALLCLALFALLLAGLPLAATLWGGEALGLLAAFYRAGALVFGGGHVVLPLLQQAVVPPGWVGTDAFLAGYGMAQALPGPLVTFASYLGTVATVGAGGLSGGLLGTLAIFLPSFLLVAGALPFWAELRANARMRAALMGVNAAVVGVLGAALYDPVFTGSVASGADLAVALAGLGLLVVGKAPPWAAVAFCAGAGYALG